MAGRRLPLLRRSNAQTGFFDRRTCAANASAYAHAKELVAVIGTYNSDCATTELPILNRAPAGHWR